MDQLTSLLTTAGDRFTTNIKSTFTAMSPEKWIRLVIIAGTYMLLRPYIIKLGAKAQMRAHEKDEATAAAEAKISPNDLRGGKISIKEIPDDTSDEEEDDDGDNRKVKGESSAADWGKKARRRQRDMIKKLLEAEEKRLQESKEEEEDKDIEEFLVKE
ncbi:protein trafficking Pga2 [Diplogelasinospora grovesii]|uniref:Protein trafficking Pga2 n=1 Tax=Diplogelasinospora grovesii TaxID=303347 RepID=A0AAN6NG51_9PEZI|nr:protein trafficking Pga2 [Diplogelasinospora grovesii]